MGRKARLKTSDIPDELFLDAIWEIQKQTGRVLVTVLSIERKLKLPNKIVRSKAGRLINRGLLEGCWCGCRGDFFFPEDYSFMNRSQKNAKTLFDYLSKRHDMTIDVAENPFDEETHMLQIKFLGVPEDEDVYVSILSYNVGEFNYNVALVDHRDKPQVDIIGAVNRPEDVPILYYIAKEMYFVRETQ